MFPRSLRLALLVLFLLSVAVFSFPLISSSAANDKGKPSLRGRSAQASQSLNQNGRTEGPPNYDAFGASRKGEAAAAAMTSNGDGQRFQSGHMVQAEPRLGVPTFLWASETGQGQAKQLSGDQSQAQTDIESAARMHLGDYGSNYRLSEGDVAAARLVAIHDTGKGAIIAKFKQELGGVEVFRDEINVIMNRELQLIALSGYLTGDADAVSSASAEDFTLGPAEALAGAVRDLTGANVDASLFQNTSVQSSVGKETAASIDDQNPYLVFTPSQDGTQSFLFGDMPLRVKKVFYHLPDGFVPAYYMEADVLVPSNDPSLLSLEGTPHTELAYSYVISAMDGQVLFRNNLIDDEKKGNEEHLAPGGFSYRVWADPVTGIPYDTPAGNGPHPKLIALPDGAQAPFVAPNDVTLPNFPFSQNDPWLAPGATETNGNNVDAFVNLFSPDGIGNPTTTSPTDPPNGDYRAQITAAGQFLHTHVPDVDASTANANQGSIQQLFYNINFLHDWFYDAGFNEASGNAQTNNFGRGGLGNDNMKAQAQDFASFNNANMLTPADGSRPRMRMYNFPNLANTLDVSAPAGIAAKNRIGVSQTGLRKFDVTGNIVIATFTSGPTTCTITNAGALAGKIAMFDFDNTDGTGCSFSTRISRIHATGAAAALMVYTSAAPTQVANITGINAAHTKGIAVISWNTGAPIKTQLAGANTVTARLLRMPDRDGALDNQVVFHEWGHYISNRLIGNGSGLNNQQGGGMGEGWGDFTAMLLTVRANDTSTPSNTTWNGAYALATYATSGVPYSGALNHGYYLGIRRLPYSTDMVNLNALTFKHIQDGIALPTGPPIATGGVNSEVHNTGEVWATMLWECYAALLRDTQGATPRLTFQQAQDRMKNYLVAGYKMTPLSPTFLEARDAILAAAFAYDYNDGRLFAQAFAKRGAGVAAIAPDRFSATNSTVTESFDAGGAVTYVSAALDDSVVSCDNDNYLDNGEKGLLTVTVKNNGFQNLFNTTATITSSNPKVTFPNGATINFSTMQPGQSSTASLAVTASGMTGTDNTTFTITIQDSGPPTIGPVVASYAEYLNVDEVAAASATETVEPRQTPWTTANNPSFGTNATAQWRRTAPGGGLNHVWLGPDIGAGSDQYLISPVFTVNGSGSANIQFDHSWGFEFDATANYDGGVVEMQVNGGAWTDIGGAAYNGTIANYTGDVNPLKGRPGFVKNSAGTIHTSLTQAIAPGSTVRFRFRTGTDSAVGAAGWQVDNIALSGVVETPSAVLVAETFSCNPPPPPSVTIVLSPATAPAGNVGAPYSLTLTPSNGTAPYSYSITPAVLPPGLVSSVVGDNLVISGTPTQVGTYLLTVKTTDSAGVPLQSNTNYTITINKGTPAITWNDPADITYGTALGATQLNASANVPGSFIYNPLATTVLNAGAAQALTVTFNPTDTTNYQSTQKTVHINVLKATPTITWSNPSDITYGTALGATQLNATASVPGAFVYTPAAGTVLDVGNGQNLSVNFTPTDTTNYTGASKNVSINVLKATPTITWSNPADITYGTALTATQLNATASAPGLITFSPAAGTFLNAGNAQTLSASFTPTDTTRYNSNSKNVSINVLKANQTITFGTLSGKTFGDAPFNLSATSSSGLPVVFQIQSGPAIVSGNTVTITGAGTVTVRASVATNSNFNNATPVDQSFNVAKSNQTITFGALPSKTFGDAPFNLSATSTSSLPVSFSRVSGPVTLVGNTVTITGTGHVVLRASQIGDTNYNAAPTVDSAFDVVSANATVALSNLAFTYDGAAHAATVTTTPAGLSFTLTYSQNNVPVAAPTNAGSYAVSVSVTDPNYQGSTTGTLVINKATPVITWANPANIIYGTPLGAAQFNATANVPGTFQYSLPVGTVLSVGSYQLSTNFTPTDSANYNVASKSVPLTVDVVPLPALSFTSAAYAVGEAGGSVLLSVNRTGDTSGAVTVNYATSDTAGLNPCNLINNVASSRCDYATTVGTLRFAAGESSKSISIPVVDDSFKENPEAFTVTLSNPAGATLGVIPVTTVTITDNDPVNGANPISSSSFLIRQLYIDFLGREPDPIGNTGWQDILNNCAPGDTRCDRIEVASAFFRSEEFQSRGYFVYRLYSSVLGRVPHYAEFMPDLAKVSGFLTPEQLEANKVAFVNEFMGRSEFQTRYGSLTTPTAFVDALLQAAGLPNHPSRPAWITALTNSTMTRAQVVRALIESTEVYNKYYTEAFVVLQYFGFLRHDADILYLQWIQTMNQNGGDYRVMINGFLNSQEYVQRFGL